MKPFIPWKRGEVEYLVNVLTGRIEPCPETMYPCAWRAPLKSGTQLAAEAKRARKAAKR